MSIATAAFAAWAMVMPFAAGMAYAQGPPPAGPGGDSTTIVDAQIATITVDGLAPGVGIQGVALNLDRTRLYVSEAHRTTMWNGQRCGANPQQPSRGTGGVGVFDTASLTRVTDLRLPDGFPIHTELDAATGRLYAATSPDWTYGFEGVKLAVSKSTGGAPHDIGIDTISGRGVVTNVRDPAGASNQTYLALVDLASLQTLRLVDSRGFGPHKAAVDPDRHLAYISHAEFPSVTVVDTVTGDLLRHIPTGLQRGGAQNAIDLMRRRLYVVGVGQDPTRSLVAALDLATEQRIPDDVPLNSGGHGMRVDAPTGLLWVVDEERHQVSVIDPATMRERARVPVGHCPYYLDIDPVLRRAYVTNQGDNTVSVIDMARVTASESAPGLAALNRVADAARSALDTPNPSPRSEFDDSAVAWLNDLARSVGVSSDSYTSVQEFAALRRALRIADRMSPLEAVFVSVVLVKSRMDAGNSAGGEELLTAITAPR